MPAESEVIFRKAALERLSSPDQLDRLITLSSPAGWAAFVALVALCVGIVAWAFLGSVPTRVTGAGILVTRGGQVFDAMAPAEGTITKVAAAGTGVQKGEVVATLDDTQAGQDLDHARTVLREREEELAQVKARFEGEIAARRRVDAQQRENLSDIIASSQQRKRFYTDALRGDEEMVTKGFVSNRFAQQTRQQLDQAEQDGQRARNDLLRIDAEELDLTGRRDEEVWRRQEAVNDARRAVEELSIRNARRTRVVTPIAGHVTEVKAVPGTVVAAGRSILSIETGSRGLEMVLYVPPEQGKKIAAGMEVRIEPATVRKEEYGTLTGHILEVSEFPVSTDGMLAVLQNRQLASRFSAQGAPYAARVALQSDPGTPSGYAWSGGRGPPVKLTSGTTAAAEVTVRTQAPISLVLPLFRRRTGIPW